jgi:microcystin-dependent protein
MESYLGAVFAFGFNFPPVGWLPCDGRVIPISGNDALFNLIGTTYGGDGQATFALPNLGGRVPIGTGQGPGLSNYVLGQTAGSENTTLTTANLPAHNHPVLTANVPVSATEGESNDPTGRYLGVSDGTVGPTYYATSDATLMAVNTSTTGVTGSSLPIEIMNPYLAINYCICTEGIYPQQS